MKFICAQNELATNLSLISRAVPSRPTHPVLANVLLSADEEQQQVSLTAFDLSLGIKTSFAAKVETSGTLTLPAKLFNDIISRLPEGEVTLDDERPSTGEDSATEAGILATITSTSGRYEVRGMSAEEFPALPTISEGQTVQLPAEALMQGLHGTLFATSGDETKQVLTGVHLIVHADSLEFAATDGHRLAIVETINETEDSDDEAEPDEDAEELEVTVPARALRELDRIVGMHEGHEPISLNFDPGQIVLELGGFRLTSRTLEGQYPAYSQLVPRSFERQVTVERRQLLSALERIGVLADRKNNIVKFSIDQEKQMLSLSVEAADVGSGRESMSAQITGESLDIAFNVKYAMESLKNISATEIIIKLNSATSPVVLSPLTGVKMTHLIMPVQMRG
ncbi:DNA polymerase III subunit beta [Laspinema olomoucense]|uniref:Beta sliding clamp n=1 Tax=Laspinema olomoucense D3b TaxID=2953688 RepID=A0ABT2NBJ5_9CYAN|nr:MULTISPECIES: DNA polymerase III subunit beta [unclassified Laspinema]MCT7971603.1 DNA polymerase III subunit beta [Laspinema sp. D3d]MCT7979095.1 DNA polymerase III subunit beta [Laspinema sp. D3b]